MKRQWGVLIIGMALLTAITGLSSLTGCSTPTKARPIGIKGSFDAKNSGLGDSSQQMTKIKQLVVLSTQYDLATPDDPAQPKPNGRSAFEKEVQRKIDEGELAHLLNLSVVYLDNNEHHFAVK